MLAKRLIYDRSSLDMDIETFMINGLKQACGFEYTSKLQRMFTDITLSNDLNEKFKNYVQSNQLDLDKSKYLLKNF